MSELSVAERQVEVARSETNTTFTFDATARLLKEGPSVTIASVKSTTLTEGSGADAPSGAIGIVSVASPLIFVTLDPSLLALDFYSLLCTYTSSNDNDQPMQVDVIVKY